MEQPDKKENPRLGRGAGQFHKVVAAVDQNINKGLARGKQAENARHMVNIAALVEAGMAILPLIGKEPHRKYAPRGVYSATRDLKRIEQWLLLGLNLGATSPDGRILYIDVDPRNGGDMRSLCLTKRGR